MQRWLYIDEAHRGAGHIPLEISRFRSAIYRRYGHFLLYPPPHAPQSEYILESEESLA